MPRPTLTNIGPTVQSADANALAQSPFPRAARRRQAAASRGGLALAPERNDLADPFIELLDEARQHRGAHDAHQAHPIGLPTESQALRNLHLRERVYRRSLAIADGLVAGLAGLIAFAAVGSGQLSPAYLALVPLMIVAAKVWGLYDRDELVTSHSTLNELPRLLNLATMFTLVVWVARHSLVTGDPHTWTLVLLWALVSAGLIAGRTLARELAGRLTPVERCLLVGRRDVYDRLHAKFADNPRVSLVGSVRTEEIALDSTTLRRIAERDDIHRIVIDTDDYASPETTIEIVRAANATGVQVSLLPSLLGAVGGSVVFDDVGGMVLMGVPRFGLGRSSRAIKRSFDLVTTTLGVIVAAPALVVVAIAIKLDSPGPVLFRQTRIGRGGRPFKILKFRTMVDGADALKDSLRHQNEAEGLFKIGADPRITRIGGWLRRTGVDELPQLFNVLAGSMSLVGPRPLVADEDLHVKGFDRDRLHLTPGITGRWQTLGSARIPLAEMVKIDYLYVASWSLWSDLKIDMQTFGYLARGRGQ